MWKTSCLLLIPKTNSLTSHGLTNLRPIALTLHIMTFFERVVLGHLFRQVSVLQDPLQFAHRTGLEVDDALLFILHGIYRHLETTASSVRIIFFSFLF